MSQAAEIRKADARAETRLLRLLGHGPEWLYELRYERGLAWLHQHFGFDPRLEQALATMPGPQNEERNLFWAWWLNDWQHRDQVLSAQLTVLPSGVACYGRGGGVVTMIHSPDQLNYFYDELHDPKSSTVKLPGFVREAAHRYLKTTLPDQ